MGLFIIEKTWLFALLEVHFAQSKGTILTDIRKRIIDVDRETPIELGGCYRTPEGLRVWLLGGRGGGGGVMY